MSPEQPLEKLLPKSAPTTFIKLRLVPTTSIELKPSVVYNTSKRESGEREPVVGKACVYQITKPEDLNAKLLGRDLTVREEILNIYFDTMGPVYNEDPAKPVMLKHDRDLDAADRPASVTTSAEQALESTFALFLNGAGAITLVTDEKNNPIGITCQGQITEAKAIAMFTDAHSKENILGRLSPVDQARPISLLYFAGISPSHQSTIIDGTIFGKSGLNAEEVNGRSLYKLFWRARLAQVPSGNMVVTRTINPKVETVARAFGFNEIGKVTFTVPSVKTVKVFCLVKD